VLEAWDVLDEHSKAATVLTPLERVIVDWWTDTGSDDVELFNRTVEASPQLRRTAHQILGHTSPPPKRAKGIEPQRWRHLVHCNAGVLTPLGGDMCICLRELCQLVETLSNSRYIPPPDNPNNGAEGTDSQQIAGQLP
jgi:hypothetical protein